MSVNYNAPHYNDIKELILTINSIVFRLIIMNNYY